MGEEELTLQQDEIDNQYQQRFWGRKAQELSPKYLEGLKNQMKISVLRALESGDGTFATFISFREEGGRKLIDEESREKLSAYRHLANSMGVQIGKFEAKPKSGTALASIERTTD